MGQEEQSAEKGIMINKVWEWFNAQGYKGSVSVCDPKALRLSTQPAFTCKANTPDDDTFIYEQIFEIDPDYRVAAIIKEAAGIPAREWQPDGAQEPAEISFEGTPDQIQGRIDDAILEGLAHKKILRIRESGAIVKFGYKIEDLF